MKKKTPRTDEPTSSAAIHRDLDSDFVFDPARAKQALDRLGPVLASVNSSVLDSCRPKVDLLKVASVVLAVAEYASRVEVRRTFASLPSDLFEMRHLERLTDLGWAAWYAKLQYNDVVSSKAAAREVSALGRRVAERKERMLRLVEYHLRDNPVASLQVKSLRKGGGYLDAASDLTALAVLYRAHRELLSTDKQWYREDDAREAEIDVAALIHMLGKRPKRETKEALDLLARVYVCVQDAYGEVRAAACFAFRHRPEILEHFPVLHTAVCQRKSEARRLKKAETSSEGPSEPSEQPSE